MLLTLFVYLSIFAFCGLSIRKCYQYAKMPMHGRWELYPVPKEAGGKAHYGGSYYEEAEWWNKPREVSHSGEIIDMLKEMLFIKNLFVNQKRQWWFSYALHLGIYLLGLWTALLLVGAVTELNGVPLNIVHTDQVGSGVALIYYLTYVSGILGALLAACGSICLFLKRIFSQTMSKYTTLQEYFNLFFIFAVVISGLVVWSGDPGFNYGREIFKSLLTFSPIHAGVALTVHILLLGALLIYIPQTKMSHYVGKYFAFHKVLWDNEPNLPNSQMENVIKGAISYKPKVSWSAPHINPNMDKKENQ